MTKTIHNRQSTKPYKRISQPTPRLIRGDFPKKKPTNQEIDNADKIEANT